MSRIKWDHPAVGVTLAAERQGRMIGMLHLRNGNHIAMLFVERREQKRGIGPGLVLAGEQYARARQPTVRVLTGSATPNAIGAYRAIGFVPVGSEHVMKGLRYIPMEHKLA